MPAAPSNESALMPAVPSDGRRVGLYMALSSLSRFSLDVSYDVHHRVHIGLLEGQEGGGEQYLCYDQCRHTNYGETAITLLHSFK